MEAGFVPLFDDDYASAPLKRALDILLRKCQNGMRGVGYYCGYAPCEMIRAMGAVPIGLCAFSNATIAAAEVVLPANLCPLIKSSYGFIATDTCPFFALSEAVIAETTCDGKKKMFELMAHTRPLHVMDLPQLPDEPEAVLSWTSMMQKLKAFLESTFDTTLSDERIEEEIQETNRKNRLMNRLFRYAALERPVLSWSEMYDVIAVASVMTAEELQLLLDGIFPKLEERVASGRGFGKPGAPRILVGGCPVGGDSTKVFKILEDAGGVVVALDACTGMKGFANVIREGSGDPMAALAEAYLKIPCSCMSPNTRRLDRMDYMIGHYRPDAIVDVVLQACHSYNIESYKVERYVQSKHGLPFLKIETDYSNADVERIRTRVEALLETC